MKKLIIIFLLLIAGSSFAQIDTATWSIQRDGLGYYSVLTNRVTVGGVVAGGIRTPLIMSLNEIDTTNFQLIRDGLGYYSAAISKADMYGIDSGKIRVTISYSVNPFSVDEAHTWTQPQTFDSTVLGQVYKQTVVSVIADSTINCNLSNTFSKTLGANQRFVLSNIGDGQTVNIAVTNTAGNYTVTWVNPDGLTIVWKDNLTPTQTIGSNIDSYRFIRLGTKIFGEQIKTVTGYYYVVGNATTAGSWRYSATLGEDLIYEYTADGSNWVEKSRITK